MTRPIRRVLLTFTPPKRVYLCPHNLWLDRAGLCPECAAKVEAKRLLSRLRRRVALVEGTQGGKE